MRELIRYTTGSKENSKDQNFDKQNVFQEKLHDYLWIIWALENGKISHPIWEILFLSKFHLWEWVWMYVVDTDLATEWKCFIIFPPHQVSPHTADRAPAAVPLERI